MIEEALLRKRISSKNIRAGKDDYMGGLDFGLIYKKTHSSLYLGVTGRSQAGIILPIVILIGLALDPVESAFGGLN